MPMCDYISFFIIFRSKFLFNYKVLGIVDIAKFYAGRPRIISKRIQVVVIILLYDTSTWKHMHFIVNFS